MGKYELLYIVHPDLESSIDKITEKTRSFIESRKGKITYEENWGKRKLAYPIKKADTGIYVLWYFESPQSALAKIERDIRLTEEIVRFMILATPDKIKVVKTKKTEAKPAEGNAVSQTEAPGTEKEKAKPNAPKAALKAKPNKKAPVESEKERMKKLDEQLGALLGEEKGKDKK